MISTAYAMGQGANGQGAGGFSAFIPLILMFVIFYFLLIRPQQKKAKQHKDMTANLKKGDRVVTGGGMYGIIVDTDENTASVEIAENVRVKINRGSIASLVSQGPVPKEPKKKELGE